MTFPGLPVKKDREDLIAYLMSPSEAGTADRGRATMGMDGPKTNLKKAPPEGQVVSPTHCGETYTLTTADGATNKVWEFNLRLKTDSSKLGPPPGKPVIVGAGMRGDRASVVLAAPGEISAFIKPSCK